MKKVLNFWDKLFEVLRTVEKYFLVFILSLMVGVSFLQIILRTFFKAVEWFDPLLRYSVLWIGIIAASMATFENKHIKIDILGRIAKGRLKSLILSLTNLIAAIVSFIISYASVIYIIKLEFNAPDPPPFLNIPRWVLLLIIPFGFGIIGIRFMFRVATKVKNLTKNIEDNEDEEIETDIKDNLS